MNDFLEEEKRTVEENAREIEREVKIFLDNPVIFGSQCMAHHIDNTMGWYTVEITGLNGNLNNL
jgi:hypothetical protein